MTQMTRNDVPLMPDELPEETKQAARLLVATKLEASGQEATLEVLDMLGLLSND